MKRNGERAEKRVTNAGGGFLVQRVHEAKFVCDNKRNKGTQFSLNHTLGRKRK